MSINVFVPTFHVEEILGEIRQCLEKGWTGMGFKTVEFEEAWKKYAGVRNAHFIASNTVGLHLALHTLGKVNGWKEGDEVISTPLTFVSTNHAILYERLQPVFADVDEFLCLDPKSIEARITSRTKAVIYVGMGGNSGRLGEVADLCRRKNLKLILDAAHMAGTRYRGRHVGNEADVTVFSFQAVKNLPTADSGMICFQDEGLDKLARELSWLGINKDTYQRFQGGSYRWKYDVPNVGFKYHGNSIQAAIGLVQLKYLDQDNDRRRQIAALYDELVGSCPGISVVEHSQDCQSSRHLYQIRVRSRDVVLETLYGKGIFPGVHYVDNSEYPMYAGERDKNPNAHRYSEELISLPVHLRMTEEDCRFVAAAVKDAIRMG